MRNKRKDQVSRGNVIEPNRLSLMETELRALMASHLGVDKPTLAKALHTAGRRLPKRQRVNGALIVDALERAEHPGLYAQLDEKQISRAHTDIVAHLKRINISEEKMRRIIRIGSAVAFNLLFVVGAVIALLRWRGFV
ncbi:hypothetical protein [Lentibacter sp. XHP0401]|uniref:hypothetical protein n=1 Tax=Lentibacter sp. XHP0401 TaxID=2984334 RepID=UPI0021E706AF|nr:hypothetical protein [Lentibacter sp. XHP0401]MCV2893250.1 hypothetical protein [Lentibacter sp. XHP0401]